jgi:phospholipid-translocating ATPase
MIQEANIGCGLFGLEGSQAAMSADYAFGQFRFLAKLLLVHGRWSYQRIADMHSNFFYKVCNIFNWFFLFLFVTHGDILQNVIWTFAMFWFLFWNRYAIMLSLNASSYLLCFASFDATYLYEYTFILLYNLAFTSLPVIVLGGTCSSSDHGLSTISSSLQHLIRISTRKPRFRIPNFTNEAF